MIKYRSGERIPYVSIFDPAVDQEKCDHQEFAKTLDAKYRPLREGVVPTTFHLGRLTRSEMQEVRRAASHERATLLVAYGLKDVENMPDVSGQPVRLSFKQVGSMKRIDDATLDRIYSPDLFDELAVVINEVSGLDPLGASR